MSKTLKDINLEIREFIKIRNWEASTPQQLLISIFTELGELSELYQWNVDFNKFKEEDFKKRVSFEMVDVFIYLMRLADQCDIDLEQAFNEKLPLLGEKYPVGIKDNEIKSRREQYRKTGKNKLYD